MCSKIRHLRVIAEIIIGHGVKKACNNKIIVVYCWYSYLKRVLWKLVIVLVLKVQRIVRLPQDIARCIFFTIIGNKKKAAINGGCAITLIEKICEWNY